ncbi:hypothetical protein C8R46DRAFT_1045557 [Mycena filopes]|nr:hypothetical protein C8R46DRAFT_1045557 [Mycena filopes]
MDIDPTNVAGPSRTSSSSSEDTLGEGTAASNSLPGPPKKLYPLFRRNLRADDSLSPQSTSAVQTPNLPDVPDILPSEIFRAADADSATRAIIDGVSGPDSTTPVIDSGLFDADDTPSEDSPDPEGKVSLYLAKIQKDVKNEIIQHQQPQCYRNNTFWIRPMDRWFALEDCKDSLSPIPLYQPAIFVWLPRTLLPLDFLFRCIFCKKGIMKDDGWNSNPIARRVVDLDSCYYVLTKRLRCETCGKGCNMYDQAILTQLPGNLGNEFPAFLTHRSGIDKKLMTLIRSGIAQGLTSHSWERVLRELHIRQRDLAEQAYLHALKSCREANLPSDLIPFSAFTDKSGYAGFSPSRYFINSVYVEYMSHIKPHQDQAMASLPCNVGHGDQSFKVIKYIARLNGVRVFGSLWTITNEYEQIRQMVFTPTKHLHHIERPLKGIVKSLHEHGHRPMSFMYTDNVQADKQFFERVVPTLAAEVDHGPADAPQKYPAVVVPDNLVVQIASTAQLIDEVCFAILSEIGDESTGRSIFVGFSVEWDAHASEKGHFPAGMMEIIVENCVYLLQIYHLNDPSDVPSSLKALLLSPRVVKVGYHIQGNIDLLSLLWDLPSPFKNNDRMGTGCVDIGVLARSKGLIPNAMLSFRKISEAVLRRNMNSLQEVRISDWCRSDVSRDQKEYAIRNAWLALEIYKAVVHQPPAGARLSRIGLLGDRVTLLNGDIVVAHGTFAEQPTKFPVSDGDPNTRYITLSRTKRALITIQKIVAPSYICHYHERTLEDMGPPPFDIVVDLSSLTAREEHSLLDDVPAPDEPASRPRDIDAEGDSEMDWEAEWNKHFDSGLDWSDTDSNSETDSDEDEPETRQGQQRPPPTSTTVDVNMFGEDEDEYGDMTEFSELVANYPEPAESLNHPIIQPATGVIPTRTLQDAWHEMNRLNEPIKRRRHSLGKNFVRWLRDAIFVPDKIDKARVEAVLKKGGITWNQGIRSKPDWIWERVRRYIPPPDQLEPILKKLFTTHADLECAKRKIRLFDEKCRKAADAMLEDVRKGWVSDPAGLGIFNRLRTDRNGLPVWHSIRGTNTVEGGVHMPLKRHFKSLGASVEMSVMLLSDFSYCKNVEIQSGSLHRDGIVYDGHYDPWIEDDIDILYQSLPFDAPRRTRPGYVNVSLFKPTHESIIVTALPEALRVKFNIPAYQSTQNSDLKAIRPPLVKLSGARTNRYEFLAAAQDTKYALTPIHTNQEYALFGKAVKPGGAFAVTGSKSPNFKEMARWWSSKVDGKAIFFKLPEHLLAHFKTWSEVRSELTTMQLTERDRTDFMATIRSDAHTSIVLDESFSPVVQGRKAAASSAKIAAKNRRYDEPSAPGPGDHSSNTAPSLRPALDTTPFLTANPGSTMLQFVAPMHATTSGLGAPQIPVAKKKRACAVCQSLGKPGAEECRGRGGRHLCRYFGQEGAVGRKQ